MIRRFLKLSGIPLLLLVLLPNLNRAQDLKQVLDLHGSWKFEVGDNPAWSKTELDDSRWDVIHVPSPWEDEGYPGYDGFAWYRKHFKADGRLLGKPLYLRLGHIDDAGEVFLNGHMIGYVGQFPPNFVSAYGQDFRCPVPLDYLLEGSDNVLAVRVYDYWKAGGLTHGNVGFYQPRDYIEPDVDLSGFWKFKTGDNKAWAKNSFDDSRWEKLKVPLFWDAQGYKEYDGIAWYRFKFRVPPGLADKRLVLLLGKIDDANETYLNGQLIGTTGDMHRPLGRNDRTTDHLQLRAYSIPPSLLIPGDENTIAVRVLDVWMHGGIYEGPIGLIRQDHLPKEPGVRKTIWERLRDAFE